MDRKRKGTAAERELLHMFWKAGWACIRVAGSGSSRYPSPDLVAGDGCRRLAIECKSSGETTKYVPKEDIEELALFARMFGAEAWIGIRFSPEWRFLTLEDMAQTDRSCNVSRKLAQDKGLLFEELIKGF